MPFHSSMSRANCEKSSDALLQDRSHPPVELVRQLFQPWHFVTCIAGRLFQIARDRNSPPARLPLAQRRISNITPEIFIIAELADAIQENTAGLSSGKHRARPGFHSAVEIGHVAIISGKDVCIPEPEERAAVMPVLEVAMRGEAAQHLEGTRHSESIELRFHAEPVVEIYAVQGLRPLLYRPRCLWPV